MSDQKESQEQALLALVAEMVAHDQALREQLGVDNKFRFIHDRLLSLQAHVEDHIGAIKQVRDQPGKQQAEDEAVVYIYLFNAQGSQLNAWQKMIGPKVFYEYSVNRPIYSEKAHVEEFIRSKISKVQHAYVSVHVKKQFLIPTSEIKDSLGHPLIKVKEGALDINNMVALTHNEHDYVLNNQGILVKK